MDRNGDYFIFIFLVQNCPMISLMDKKKEANRHNDDIIQLINFSFKSRLMTFFVWLSLKKKNYLIFVYINELYLVAVPNKRQWNFSIESKTINETENNKKKNYLLM